MKIMSHSSSLQDDSLHDVIQVQKHSTRNRKNKSSKKKKRAAVNELLDCEADFSGFDLSEEDSDMDAYDESFVNDCTQTQVYKNEIYMFNINYQNLNKNCNK